MFGVNLQKNLRFSAKNLRWAPWFTLEGRGFCKRGFCRQSFHESVHWGGCIRALSKRGVTELCITSWALNRFLSTQALGWIFIQQLFWSYYSGCWAGSRSGSGAECTVPRSQPHPCSGPSIWKSLPSPFCTSLQCALHLLHAIPGSTQRRLLCKDTIAKILYHVKMLRRLRN